jgi:hypothetical protein
MTETTDTTYNGWPNRETWLVNLWLTGNDQGTYSEVREIVRSAETERDAVDRCSEYVDQMCFGDEDPEPGLATDLLRGALSVVDWRPVVRYLREE